MTIDRGRRARGLATLAMAGLLAVVAVFVPPTAATVQAAEDFLRVSADTTYRVDTGDRLVRVRIDFTMTNLQPNTVRRTSLGTTTTRYYFNQFLFPVPAEARSLVSTSGGSRLASSVRARDGYRAVTVRFPNLFYRASRSIRVEFTLPGGKPRTSSDIRVGSAFTTFTAWAWGDAGRSTVRIALPKGFVDAGYGKDITQRTRSNGVELSSGTIREPDEWYRVVVADRPSALTDLRIEPDGRGVVVQAWPEDTVWRDRVADVLDKGLPVLEELVGLPWPVSGDLTVSEVHAPLLHGYAGFYDSATDDITMSEELDDQTILHEASHAWFNGDLVRDRWIDEGLAEYYADRARQQLGLSDEFAPTAVEPTDTGAFPLNAWPDPGRIEDEKTDAQERFGYGAAYTVILRLVQDIGEDGMRAVLAAADADENAYVGDTGPEKTGAVPDWRRFLDLVEERGDTETADDLFTKWVVPPADRTILRERQEARDAYAALDAAGAEWAVPRGVRAYMSLWRFDDATELMDVTEPVLSLRDELAGAAADLELQTPSDVEQPFEAAITDKDLDEVEATMQERLDAATAVLGARAALATEPTPLAALGLVGETPDAGYMAARSALESGDVAGAMAGAATTISLLAGAESIGTTRAIVIAAVVIGLLLLLALVVVWRRRRRSAVMAGPGPESAVANASTTLPATPEPAGVVAPEVGPTPSQIAPGAEPD
jgi:hypothetical protein